MVTREGSAGNWFPNRFPALYLAALHIVRPKTLKASYLEAFFPLSPTSGISSDMLSMEKSQTFQQLHLRSHLSCLVFSPSHFWDLFRFLLNDLSTIALICLALPNHHQPTKHNLHSLSLFLCWSGQASPSL